VENTVKKLHHSFKVGVDKMNIDLIFAWILIFLDFVMLYVFVNNLIGNGSNVFANLLSLKVGAFAIAFGLVMGTVSYLLSPQVYQIIVFPFLLTLVYIIAKPSIKKRGFSDFILIYILYYIILHMVVGLSLFLVSLFQLNQIKTNLTTYVFSTIFTFILCWRVEFSKLYTYLSYKVWVRLISFILVVIIAALSAFLNFEFSAAIQYMIIVLFIAGLLGLIDALKKTHHYTDELPNISHDISNLILLQSIQMTQTDDIDEVRRINEKIIGLIGIDTSILKDSDSSSDHCLLNTIDLLKRKKNHHADIVTKIKYFEPHRTIEDVEIGYILSVLIENAMETMTTKPIFVEILCSENRLLIKVENESKEKSKAELDQMLVKSYSSKDKIGRGFGLAKLNKYIQNNYGNIEMTQAFHNCEKVNYLTIVVYI